MQINYKFLIKRSTCQKQGERKKKKMRNFTQKIITGVAAIVSTYNGHVEAQQPFLECKSTLGAYLDD